ncbi:hypothetical protein BJ878DRAFT_166221 [Calycina marina]|uniref:Secreted protein n=1 Tax=Calycina marina TaxID=1763456 RepID=A0A9P7Z9E9_9HELO|nr:hypothetical protein BJ878DRAFT_166221 [Calycina marina]
MRFGSIQAAIVDSLLGSWLGCNASGDEPTCYQSDAHENYNWQVGGTGREPGPPQSGILLAPPRSSCVCLPVYPPTSTVLSLQDAGTWPSLLERFANSFLLDADWSMYAAFHGKCNKCFCCFDIGRRDRRCILSHHP